MNPLPTKLFMSWEDIQTDHLDVPAIFSPWWQGAKPSTPTTTFFNLLHCCRNLVSILINYSGLSKDVENHFVILCLHDRRLHRRRQIFVIIYFRIVADTSPMVFSLVYYTWWCLFWTWWTLGNASFNLNRLRFLVFRFQSACFRIQFLPDHIMIHSCLVCVGLKGHWSRYIKILTGLYTFIWSYDQPSYHICSMTLSKKMGRPEAFLETKMDLIIHDNSYPINIPINIPHPGTALIRFHPKESKPHAEVQRKVLERSEFRFWICRTPPNDGLNLQHVYIYISYIIYMCVCVKNIVIHTPQTIIPGIVTPSC